MKLRYVVRRYELGAGPEDCLARVLPTGTIRHQELLNIIAELHTSVSRSELVAVLEDHDATIINLLLRGYNVDTPLVDYRLTLQGRFVGLQDRFDPARHKVVARFRAGKRLQRALRHFGALELAHGGQLTPAPRTFYDVNSGTRDTRLTPGGIGELWGARLRVDLADPVQGIFFIAEDGRETRVTVMAQNKPRQSFFLVPELPAGSYRLQVRAFMRHSSELSWGELEKTLLVE